MRFLLPKPYRLCLALLCIAGIAFFGVSRMTTHAANNGALQDPSQSSWGMYGFDSQHSQYNPYETVLSPSTVPGLTLDWSYKTVHTSYTAQPVVANGLVYINSSDGKLRVLDASTGALRWLWNASVSMPLSTPAVVNGIVYLGADALYALDATTGSWLWDYSTKGKGDTFTSPVVVNGVVYVGTSSGKLFALNATTGARLWVQAAGGSAFAPVVANGVVYDGQYTIYAVNAANGTILWSKTTSIDLGSPCTFSITLDILYTCTTNMIYALGGQLGTIKWKYAMHQHITAPALANGVLYANASQKLVALDPRRGKPLWTIGKGNFDNRYADGSDAPPVVANGVLYVDFTSASHGWIYAVDTSTGSRLWTFTKMNVQSDFSVVANGMLYVGSDKVYAFHLL